MEIENRLILSYYKEVAVINADHEVTLVQHIESGKIFIKKRLQIYNLDVYMNLYKAPVAGTPKIIELVEDSDCLFIIEEYVPGISLEEMIESHQLSDSLVLQISIRLCEILERLHAMTPAIVHRDIKPSNIQLTHYLQPVLLDFNAARLLHPKSSDTVLLGTQGYAAPEQYGFGSSNCQTDIYALGITLREMKHSLVPSCLDLDDVISKCTEISPKDRYQSVHELKECLLQKESELNEAFPKRDKATYAASTETSYWRMDSSSNADSATNSSTYPAQVRKNPNKYLPVGFRSGSTLHMLIATPVYMLLIYICAFLEMEGTPLSFNILSNILVFFMLYSGIAVPFNYLNAQSIIPLCKSEKLPLRILGQILLIALIIAVLLIADIIAYAIMVQ